VGVSARVRFQKYRWAPLALVPPSLPGAMLEIRFVQLLGSQPHCPPTVCAAELWGLHPVVATLCAAGQGPGSQPRCPHTNNLLQGRGLCPVLAARLPMCVAGQGPAPCCVTAPHLDFLLLGRGLKSFRSSPWDAKEWLPKEYSRIFAFENLHRAHK